MSYNVAEQRAIGWYAEEHNLVPQMSVRPFIYFKKRATGEEVKVQLIAITSEYKARSRKNKATNK